ncbi:MAG: Toxin-antitoxin system, toxin component [Clostridium sp.]
MDYVIRYINLPCTVKGVTVMDEEGFFNVYINARLSYESQQKAIRHELTHIARDDFFRISKLEEIENM